LRGSCFGGAPSCGCRSLVDCALRRRNFGRFLRSSKCRCCCSRHLDGDGSSSGSSRLVTCTPLGSRPGFSLRLQRHCLVDRTLRSSFCGGTPSRRRATLCSFAWNARAPPWHGSHHTVLLRRHPILIDHSNRLPHGIVLVKPAPD
jgi:hypothetical protein